MKGSLQCVDASNKNKVSQAGTGAERGSHKVSWGRCYQGGVIKDT